MSPHNWRSDRRDFLGAVASVAALSASRLAWGDSPQTARTISPRLRLPFGYLLVQQLATYNSSRFGAISTKAEAEELLAKVAGRLDGLEFESLYYDQHDLKAHETVAQVAVARGIDLWKSTFRLSGRIRSFGPIPAEFQAHAMEPDGRIVPAVSEGKPEQPLFDMLNPEAMEWFLEKYRSRYFTRMKGLLSGLFFNEDCLPYLGKVANDRRYDYWHTPTFSPRALALWQAYCQQHNVTHNGQPVIRFPVHDRAMVANGGGQTAYYPGWNVPAVIQPGQRFVDLPRAEGVWRHWYEFLGRQFVENWIGRLAAMANEVNRGESRWKGIVYFGLHHWSLPYEQVRNPEFRVPQAHRWGAWGRQRGVDLMHLAAHPEIDAIICETYPKIAANLEGFVAEYARITVKAGKTYGVMLHRDDQWPLDLDEEARRWTLLGKYRPPLLARYPLDHMLPGHPHYSAAGEAAFADGLAQYRKTGPK